MKITPTEKARVPELSDCNPGLTPHEYNVVVAMQMAEAKTAGGIILTDATRETEGMAAQMGRLVSASPVAWTYDAELANSDANPEPGDIVMIGRYSGVLFTGADGKEYRMLKDRDVAGVVQ